VLDRSKTRITSLAATSAVVLVLGTLAGTGQASAREAGAREVSEPGVAARAWALMDLRSGEYLAGDDASEELPIASTTKIVAALDGADLDEEVTVSEDAAAYATPAYSNVGLLPGDTLSVRELLMAALISSGDDAAYALAEHVGGAYVCVILDSKEERFAASVRALRYGFAAYDRTDLVAEGRRYATIGVPYRRDESVDLVAKGNVAGLVDASPDVELAADPPDSPGAGTRLGRVVVEVDGDRVGQTPLVAKKGYERASLGQRVWYTVGGIFE